MLRCERCGSSYSARHTVATNECPRCLAKDRVSAPLSVKAFSRIQAPLGTRPDGATPYLERGLRA